MSRLPATGMHHSLNVAWFALRCLGYALIHPHRNHRSTP